MIDTQITQETTDEELADLIRANFNVRDLVRIWFDDDDGRQFLIRGGLDVMGRQFIYLRGLSETGQVGVQIIPMRQIQDIDLDPEPNDPNVYEVERRIEESIAQQVAMQNHSYEERALAVLRAAREDENAENREGDAAGEGTPEADEGYEGSGSVGANASAAEAYSQTEVAADGLIYCQKPGCGAFYATRVAYWSHLDNHDMLDMGENN